MHPVATLAWQYAAHQLFPEGLPMAAAVLLADGQDSAALRELAGLTGREHANELDVVFRAAMEELGHPVPTAAAAERHLLHQLAAGLASGALAPAEAYAALGDDREGELATEAERELLRAVTPAYCCPECFARVSPEGHRRWEDEVRTAAAALLASGDDPSAP